MAASVPSTVATFPSPLRHHCSLLPPPPSLSLCPSILRQCPRRSLAHSRLSVRVRTQALDLSGSFFEEDEDSDGEGYSDEDLDDIPSTWGPSARLVASEILMEEAEEEKETPPCPPGLRQYETMAVLIPDLPEKDRLAIVQKYEELLVAGGGMYVEVFNRGVVPLSYPIKKLDKDGEAFIYEEGISLLFTYFTKPESMKILESTLSTDYNVIRFSSFRVGKMKWD